MVVSPDLSAEKRRRTGLLFGLTAYLLWGVLPLFFAAAGAAGPLEIIAHRVLWSLLFCVLLLAVARRFRATLKILATPRLALALLLSAALILANWYGFVYAVQSGRVLEASLGYFINPLVTVGLGVLVLRERLRRLQWVAVGVGLVAVVVVAIGYGTLPWIALLLAFSFGFYGLVKSKIGGPVGALEGMTIETMIVAPAAAAYLIALTVVPLGGGSTFLSEGDGHTVLLISLGVITAVPLLCFGAAARRVPLVWIGLMQYIAPFCQFLLAVFVFRETMDTGRWIGFSLVWLALVLLTADMIRTNRRARAVVARKL
ncbi:EamA family transporter RarD [Sediminivirga luteola]|uniref:Protein RarD n=1 Tax=Sediminivirga luteola TaxID=1774748 RepID=A0A8J2TXG1_9MICO|nr:EamA family transporter RarD [Sediminivirga luteola]MCI2265437.1 EamA family transporter RarD [Sediminivirga luteola]GGA11187.1 protein RarD [Sediminivirga luteola]